MHSAHHLRRFAVTKKATQSPTVATSPTVAGAGSRTKTSNAPKVVSVISKSATAPQNATRRNRLRGALAAISAGAAGSSVSLAALGFAFAGAVFNLGLLAALIFAQANKIAAMPASQEAMWGTIISTSVFMLCSWEARPAQPSSPAARPQA